MIPLNSSTEFALASSQSAEVRRKQIVLEVYKCVQPQLLMWQQLQLKNCWIIGICKKKYSIVVNNWIQIYNLIIYLIPQSALAFQHLLPPKFHRDSRLHMAFDLTEAIGVLLSGDVNHQDVERVFDVAALFTAKPAKKKSEKTADGWRLSSLKKFIARFI